MPLLRPSRDTDLPAIARIYAWHVENGTGTFEITPPSEADMAARRGEVLARGLPWLVAEDSGAIAGYAYCNWFRPRPAYRWAAEDSIYLAPGTHRQGLGRALLAELLAQAEAAGMRRMIAVIGDGARNAGSVGVHRACGFVHTGVLPAAGWKFGAWRDVVLMERPLGRGDLAPPEGETAAPTEAAPQPAAASSATTRTPAAAAATTPTIEATA